MTIQEVAQGARSQLLIKKQNVVGTVATGDFKRLRFATHTLDVVKQTAESDEIRSDREVQDFRHGNRNASGEIASPLIYADHELLIESAMFSDFDTDHLQIGVAPQYLSIEDGALDIAQYRMFQDFLVNTWTVSMSPSNPIVRSTWNLVGSDGAANAGSSSGGTPVAASSNEPFDHYRGSLFDVADTSTGAELGIVTSLEFSVNNGVQPGFAIGQAAPAVMEYGRGRVTGRLTTYYKDATLINRFLNETETTLVMTVIDPDSNGYEFRFPRIKYNGATVPVANEQSRLITIPFVALKDDVYGSAFRIHKV